MTRPKTNLVTNNSKRVILWLDLCDKLHAIGNLLTRDTIHNDEGSVGDTEGGGDLKGTRFSHFVARSDRIC